MKTLLWLGLLGGAYYLYHNYVAQTLAATGLPPGAALAQTFNISSGIVANVYIASSGYYLQLVSAGTIVKTLGPYSQSQVATAINVQNAITQGLSTL